MLTVTLAEQDEYRSTFSEVRCLVHYGVNELRLLAMNLLFVLDFNLPTMCSDTPFVQAALLHEIS